MTTPEFIEEIKRLSEKPAPARYQTQQDHEFYIQGWTELQQFIAVALKSLESPKS